MSNPTIAWIETKSDLTIKRFPNVCQYFSF
jgi:hypothetical protein